MIRCALPETKTSPSVRCPRPSSSSSSSISTCGSTTQPAPIALAFAGDDPRRDLPDLVRLAVDDDRVPGVRAALVAADEVGVLGEQVDDLALPLVAPLRADDHGRGHVPHSRMRCGAHRRRAAASLGSMLVGRSQLARDIRELGLRTGSVALVHCRMSALGTIVGGAETVVRALLDVVGPSGTLVAYTGWEDAPPDDLDALPDAERELDSRRASRVRPRPSARRDETTAASRRRSATWPGAVHSGHPEAGVAAVGHHASLVASATSVRRRLRGRHALRARCRARRAGRARRRPARHRDARAPRGGGRPGRRQAAGRLALPRPRDGGREWRTMHDIDTSGRSAPRTRSSRAARTTWRTSRARRSRRAPAAAGRVGAGTGHVLEARALVAGTVALIEEAFSPRRGP